jgi:hypothetical protein
MVSIKVRQLHFLSFVSAMLWTIVKICSYFTRVIRNLLFHRNICWYRNKIQVCVSVCLCVYVYFLPFASAIVGRTKVLTARCVHLCLCAIGMVSRTMHLVLSVCYNQSSVWSMVLFGLIGCHAISSTDEHWPFSTHAHRQYVTCYMVTMMAGQL